MRLTPLEPALVSTPRYPARRSREVSWAARALRRAAAVASATIALCVGGSLTSPRAASADERIGEPVAKEPEHARTAGVPVRPEAGFIQVMTTPVSRVLLDGRPIGTTPIANFGVAAGRHEVTFTSLDGKTTVRRVVVVNPGQTVRLVVDLSAPRP